MPYGSFFREQVSGANLNVWGFSLFAKIAKLLRRWCAPSQEAT
jgi:hypothetical protein